jgi:class 3 adenylate cyclase/tetratricopeptide (TPR) repeat protein
LEVPCPECGKLNQPGSKFCSECGQNLQAAHEIRTVDYKEPQSYTPKHLADKILTTRSSIEGERKLVTVLFADVANFTSISEKFDPEEIHQIMDGCFNILMDQIHKYEGTINQFTGDGLMALFGAPLALEDHSHRACLSGIEIQRAMNSYGKRIKNEIGIEFKIRIGLNSGPVVVGSIGDDLRMDYTAVGDITNLAARLESNAEPGGILVSENTFKDTKEFFIFEPIGEIDVKGKNKTQKAYRLIKTSDIKTRIQASAAKGLTKFVGRKNYLSILDELYERVKSGSGQVVGVVGEAGVGKSRLLVEFRNRLNSEDFNYFEGRCLQYGGSIIYKPIMDLIKLCFDIDFDDREFIIKNKIKDKIENLDERLFGTIPSIYNLLSLKVDDKSYANLEPLQKRDKTFDAIRDLFIRLSQDKPLIIVIEDCHWIDKISEEFINYLIEWLPNTRILLILPYRPEYTHNWGNKTYYTKLGLTQLGVPSSAELIRAILKEGEVAPELEKLIIDKASGNPLFMEEYTKTLFENGIIKRDYDKYILNQSADTLIVPNAIQGIIAARIDRLEENLKQTMQVASVIGRDFAFRILQKITDMRENLKSHLLNLQGLEFIYEKKLFPELEYIFKHALTQEVAYKSLLRKRRQGIHSKIGVAIEQLYVERLEEFYEMLAYHYARSEDYEKAVEYYHLAGKRALKFYAIDEATNYFRKSQQHLEKSPAGDKDIFLILEIGTKLGFTYLMKNKYIEAFETISPLQELINEVAYPRSSGRIYIISGMKKAVNDLDMQNGIQLLEKGIELSTKTADIPALSFGYTYLAGCNFFNGNIDKAKTLYSTIVTILEEKKSWYTLSVPFCSLATIYCDEADFPNAEKLSALAYDTIEKKDDPFTRSWGNLAVGGFRLQTGDIAGAEKRLTDALKYADSISLKLATEQGLILLGRLYYRKNEFNKALFYTQQLKDKIKQKQLLLVYLCAAICVEAEINLKLGKIDVALEGLQSGRKKMVPYYEGEIYRAFGDCYGSIQKNDFQSSGKWYRRAIQVHKKIGKRLEVGRDYLSYAALMKRNGMNQEAQNYLDQAFSIFKAFDAKWDIAQVQKAMQ